MYYLTPKTIKIFNTIKVSRDRHAHPVVGFHTVHLQQNYRTKIYSFLYTFTLVYLSTTTLLFAFLVGVEWQTGETLDISLESFFIISLLFPTSTYLARDPLPATRTCMPLSMEIE